MADSASESDSGSVDGGNMMPPSPVSREQLNKRAELLQQQNRVLKVELETYKLRVKALQEENRGLKQVSVTIQAKAEQEEEFISNTLLKKIQALKKEKETLAHHYEQEEECLTNDLSRRMYQLRQEKCRLEQTLQQEQEAMVNKLMRKIERLEAETLSKQGTLEQLRREKVELEQTLEQEQEALVNKLWKRMERLEAEKRMLQVKLDQPVSDPSSPLDLSTTDSALLGSHVKELKDEIDKLKMQLANSQQEHSNKMLQIVAEERQIKEENIRLQRRLQLEVERRDALSRPLSESESSLEMDEERQYSEQLYCSTTSSAASGHGGGLTVTTTRGSGGGGVGLVGGPSGSGIGGVASCSISSPIPPNCLPSPNSSSLSRPRSPVSMTICQSCGQPVVPNMFQSVLPSTSPPQGILGICSSTGRQLFQHQQLFQRGEKGERFIKPAAPASPSSSIGSIGGPMSPSTSPNPSPNPNPIPMSSTAAAAAQNAGVGNCVTGGSRVVNNNNTDSNSSLDSSNSAFKSGSTSPMDIGRY